MLFQKILIFVAFLCPLIFFHELGHFFFARFFGVRVEVFSIGFGPKIFKYVKNGTQYAISIIPLGGYVKMFGDDPFSEVQLTDEEKSVAFNHKSKWARFWIVFGGPLANLILAYVLYVCLLTAGEKVPETKVGLVPENSALHAKGLRTGDVLTSLNGESIMSVDDFNMADNQIRTIGVKRLDQTVSLNIGMDMNEFMKEFKSVYSVVKKPVFVQADGKKYYASLNAGALSTDTSLEEIASQFKGTLFLYEYEEGETLTPKAGSEKKITSTQTDMLEALRAEGYYPVELLIRKVVDAKPADKAGIKVNDILVAYNGIKLTNFEDLRNGLQKLENGKEVTVDYLSGGKQFTKTVIPDVMQVEKESVKVIGVESGVEYVAPKLIVARAENFGVALTSAFKRTVDGVKTTFDGYMKLITRKVSLDNIGGPLAIGKVASDYFNVSLSMFFRLMAFISINLGVINLFPIPVLDGGHIVFLGIEALNGGPLSRRKLEFAQRIGVSVLFLLIFIALFNDITRLF